MRRYLESGFRYNIILDTTRAAPSDVWGAHTAPTQRFRLWTAVLCASFGWTETALEVVHNMISFVLVSEKRDLWMARFQTTSGCRFSFPKAPNYYSCRLGNAHTHTHKWEY